MHLKRSASFIFILLLLAKLTLAQPYFDIAGVSTWHMPAELNGDTISETQGMAFIAIPLTIGTKGKLIFSPYYEQRYLEADNVNKSENLKSLTLPFAWLYAPTDSSWSLLAFGAFRSNSTQFRFNGDVFQVAGALLGSVRVNRNLTLKAGAYLSKEFYGDFFMILAGVEWKISNRLHLFGMVNNNLRLEYRFREKFYWGLSFKSINNSYRINGDGGYYKISDNHLGTYADIGLGKNLVWNLEAGHTIFRYIKGRNGADFPEIKNDGFILKSGLAYRIRFY